MAARDKKTCFSIVFQSLVNGPYLEPELCSKIGYDITFRHIDENCHRTFSNLNRM